MTGRGLPTSNRVLRPLRRALRIVGRALLPTRAASPP